MPAARKGPDYIDGHDASDKSESHRMLVAFCLSVPRHAVCCRVLNLLSQVGTARQGLPWLNFRLPHSRREMWPPS